MQTLVLLSCSHLPPLKIQIMLSCLPFPLETSPFVFTPWKATRPRKNLTSACGSIRSWNSLVLTAAGISSTHVLPFCHSSYAFLMNLGLSTRLYGGLQKLLFPQSSASPSNVAWRGQGSKSKLNSAFSWSYSQPGVAQWSFGSLPSLFFFPTPHSVAATDL
jgi:hypothetical protein